MTNRATFMDYIRGGTQICLICAIDFTESNLPPSDPNSLHYISNNNGEMN